MKCAYTSCKETYDLTKENAVRKGNKYYHSECSKKMNGKTAIRELYISRVSDTVVASQLNKVIQSIVDVKNISVEYLYFALRYAINHGFAIKSPMGMHYIIDNADIKKSYAKFLAKSSKPEEIVEEKEIVEVVFTLPETTKNNWNLFGG
jgi:hypothetical protein